MAGGLTGDDRDGTRDRRRISDVRRVLRIDGDLDLPSEKSPARRPGSLGAMSTVELDERALEAARREAYRRGVDVSEVVSAAVRRFVAGADLGDLLADLRRRDGASGDALSEEQALRIADEELDAFRSERA